MAELAKGGLWVNVLSLPIFFFSLIPGSWNSHKESKQWLPELQLSLCFFIVSRRLKWLPGWLWRGLNLGEHLLSSRALTTQQRQFPWQMLTQHLTHMRYNSLVYLSQVRGGRDSMDLKLDRNSGHILPPETWASLRNVSLWIHLLLSVVDIRYENVLHCVQ